MIHRVIRQRFKFSCLLATMVWICMLGGRFASAETVTLNLVDAEIRTVIATISEATGKNFLVDPRVKGKVTVISSIPLDGDALYDVFLSILEVHGYAAIENDGIVKIVPQNMAKQSSIPIETDSSNYDGAQKITKVLRLEHVSAAKLIPVLRPLVPKEGHMAAYIPANALIISDSAANIARLGRIVESIDKPTNSSIEVVQLKKASATKVVQLLKSLQTGKEKGAAAVLAVADERTNSVLLSGDPAKRVVMRSIIQQLDEPIELKTNDRVVFLNHAIAKEMAPILDKTINAKIKQGNRKAGVTVTPANIQADEATNSLIISASPDQHKALLSIIEKLDIRRAQVMVEAIIVDLDATKARDLGVQMAGTGDHGSFVSRSSNTGTSISGALAGAAEALPIVGDGLTFLGASENFALMFKALESDADTNILSTPSLFTLDNNEAEIVVGKNVPFVTGTYTDSGTDSTNPFQTIEREDVGLTLKIKPHINEGDVVTLEISLEVSSLSPSVEGASDLVTNKRLITTTVVIDDGEIVSLGGLIDDRVTESISGIPYLSKIPYIGALFRSTSTEISKRMMMVFFRPSIIRDQEGSRAIMQSNYQEIRNRQFERKESDPTRDPAFEYPLLPELELITPESGKQLNYQKLRRQQDENSDSVPESDPKSELDTAESAAQ
ncbi:MAG: type II secretion system secretin GspD [Pseudomonadales bacterium]|nr:type II secretion system secretin GspD [Pseudomonadales bacterium]